VGRQGAGGRASRPRRRRAADALRRGAAPPPPPSSSLPSPPRPRGAARRRGKLPWASAAPAANVLRLWGARSTRLPRTAADCVFEVLLLNVRGSRGSNPRPQREEFSVYWRKFERACSEHRHGGGPVTSGGGVGPAGLLGRSVLPDLASGDWEPMGTAQVRTRCFSLASRAPPRGTPAGAGPSSPAPSARTLIPYAPAPLPTPPSPGADQRPRGGALAAQAAPGGRREDGRVQLLRHPRRESRRRR
jgi:hypothetical protein